MVLDLLVKTSSSGKAQNDSQRLTPINPSIEADHEEGKMPTITSDVKNNRENVNPTADQASGILKHIDFEKMDRCTIKFHFSV